MVQKRKNGRQFVTAELTGNLPSQVEAVVENNPELSESRLVREALRRELQQYEVEQ